MIKDDRKKISEDTNGMSMTYFQKQKKKRKKRWRQYQKTDRLCIDGFLF